MSKWLKIVCLVLSAVALSGVTYLQYQDLQDFKERGKVAIVDPIDKYVQETTITKKLFTESKSTKNKATMEYTTEDNQRVSFERVLDDETLAKFEDGETVYVEYIPGERNRERFLGEQSHTTVLFVFLALSVLNLGYLIYVVRDDSW